MRDRYALIGPVVVIGLILFGLGAWFVRTKTEQNTFNRFSKEKVTFWEAAFTELRVEPQR